MSLFGNTKPSIEDELRLRKVAGMYGDVDQDSLFDALLFAYGLGALAGNASGVKFGEAMIDALRKDGAIQ